MDVDRLYLVLGFLTEFPYGRMIFDGDVDFVEFANAAPPEAQAWFTRQLDALARERQVAPATLESDERLGWPVLRSHALAALINGCYADVRSEGMRDAEGRAARHMYASRAMFRDSSKAQILSYLAGAFVRDGKDNAFDIAMADHKVDVVAGLLEKLGCSDLTVTYRPGWVPRVHCLRYKPTAEVEAWLARAREL